MALLEGPAEHQFLRNAALLFFSEYPERFFPYTFIDLVYFPKGPADKQFSEKQFKGPVQHQITQALSFIQGNLLQELVTKIDGQAEAVRVWNYPYEALEELLANCIYHRNYQEREPVTIRVEPQAIYIYNIGGPDRSIRIEDFQKGRVFPQRYRNKRVGDFLKELDLTEGRATGIPVILTAMRNNGSSEPIFETDEDRSWFRVTLPIHPAFDPETAREFRKPAEIEQRLARLIRSLVVNDYVDDHAAIMMAKVLLSVESQSRSKSQLLEYIQLKNHNDNVKRYIEPLENNDFITKTIPNKPKSPKQEYKLTEKGRLLFQQILNYS